MPRSSQRRVKGVAQIVMGGDVAAAAASGISAAQMCECVREVARGLNPGPRPTSAASFRTPKSQACADVRAAAVAVDISARESDRARRVIIRHRARQRRRVRIASGPGRVPPMMQRQRRTATSRSDVRSATRRGSGCSTTATPTEKPGRRRYVRGKLKVECRTMSRRYSFP